MRSSHSDGLTLLVFAPLVLLHSSVPIRPIQLSHCVTLLPRNAPVVGWCCRHARVLAVLWSRCLPASDSVAVTDVALLAGVGTRVACTQPP